MDASIVDLRYKMNDVLKALDRNEEVRIFLRGKLKGRIIGIGKSEKDGNVKKMSVADHEFFGMLKDDTTPVEEIIDKLRTERTHVIWYRYFYLGTARQP